MADCLLCWCQLATEASQSPIVQTSQGTCAGLHTGLADKLPARGLGGLGGGGGGVHHLLGRVVLHTGWGPVCAMLYCLSLASSAEQGDQAAASSHLEGSKERLPRS